MDNEKVTPPKTPPRSPLRVRLAAFVILACIAGVLIYLKEHPQTGSPGTPTPASMKHIPEPSPPPPTSPTVAHTALPRLVDLGATKCIPCKMMAPILEELKKDLAGKLEVEFIDVWEKPDDAKKYGVLSIPTQIFFDATGKELFRHEGFFAREDILAQWKELGFSLVSPTSAPALSATPDVPPTNRQEP